MTIEGVHDEILLRDIAGLQDALKPFTSANMEMIKNNKQVISAITAYRKNVD